MRCWLGSETKAEVSIAKVRSSEQMMTVPPTMKPMSACAMKSMTSRKTISRHCTQLAECCRRWKVAYL